MQRTRIRELLASPPSDTPVTFAGWIRTRRDSKGGFSFLEINDGSCFANLQVIIDQTLPNYATELTRLHPGSSVAVSGRLIASSGSKQAVEVKAETVRVLGFCDPETYPLGKQRINLDRLREIAHLRARTNTFGAVARVRNVLADEVHRFFQSRGFLYLHTPIITASDCEGAGAMFQVTTLNIDQAPRTPQGQVDYDLDFFGRRAALTVSGQLEGETYACALGDIYTFGPTFRAENSNTRRHLAEFWMVEPEMAFADLHDDATLAEAFLKHLFTAVLARCGDDLAFFEQRFQPGLMARLSSLASSQFHRMTYTEAVDLLMKSGKTFDFPAQWGMDLQSEHERHLTEDLFKGPVIVTDYPQTIKAFYMRRNDDGRTVAAMDVLLPEIGEIIGGSQREERLDVLEAAICAQKLNPADYSWYLDLRRFGSVPHAGFGLGFERMVQFCTGMHNIRDVIPYPRAPRTCEF